MGSPRADKGRRGRTSTLAGAAAYLKLDLQVCFPLYAASNLLTRLYRPVLMQLGLTYPQYLVMLVLWESSPMTVGDLGERLHLDSGTLTPLLKRLESARLVTRTRSRTDERRVDIALTSAGRRLRRRAAMVPATLGEKFAGSPQDLNHLREEVSQMVETLRHHVERKQSQAAKS